MKKRTRKNVIYKVRMWVYRLTYEDVKRFFVCVYENVALILAAIVMFGLLFFLPALFH